MKNGQLKPGYNVNVATVSEYIVGNYISADRTDTKVFIPFSEEAVQCLSGAAGGRRFPAMKAKKITSS